MTLLFPVRSLVKGPKDEAFVSTSLKGQVRWRITAETRETFQAKLGSLFYCDTWRCYFGPVSGRNRATTITPRVKMGLGLSKENGYGSSILHRALQLRTAATHHFGRLNISHSEHLKIKGGFFVHHEPFAIWGPVVGLFSINLPLKCSTYLVSRLLQGLVGKQAWFMAYILSRLSMVLAYILSRLSIHARLTMIDRYLLQLGFIREV